MSEKVGTETSIKTNDAVHGIIKNDTYKEILSSELILALCLGQ